MSMFKNLRDIVKLFRFDETLLRLLHYPPEDIAKNVKDPLSPTLPNVLEIDTTWSIRDKHIFLVPKADDLVTTPICRIYLYAGRRQPQTRGSFAVANQEVIVDILCHMDFEKDLRSMRISDRINELLVMERVTGLGKMDYVDGRPISAPSGYVGYQHVYEFGSSK